MGTNNPSEEQLALVESRIIALADSCVDPGLPLDSDSYFDEHGFDLESAAGQLAAKLKAYCKDAEGLEPSLEDHPQVRRMARYLLENVDYEVLEAPLSNDLLSSKKPAAKSAAGGGGALLFGFPRPAVIGAALLLLVIICALVFFLSGASTPSLESKHGAPHVHAAGGRGGRAGRRAGLAQP